VKLVKEMSELKKIGKGDVLVTYMTEPDYVPAMEKASAIVTDAGGTTAHAAIVSRELGIPCIVGTGNATAILKENQLITVDGLKGLVYSGKIEVKEEAIVEQKKLFEAREEKPEERHVLRIEELTSTEKGLIEKFLHAFNSRKVLVKVNVALARAAERAYALEPEGIGLLRAEHLITKSGEHPAEFLRRGEADKLKETLKEELKEIMKYFKGKPVWYRTFDARTDEYRGLEGGDKEPKEGNPMLGWHGIRRSIDQPELIKAEFKAIKEMHEEGYTGLGVMLPFVQHVDEVRQAKKLALEVGLDLNEIDFGVMIETPAACMIIDDLIKENIRFASFGTNDLTQMTLGLDRNNPLVQKWFHEMHPAMMKLIKFVIDACKAKGVETSICGQAGSDPEMVKALVRMGIDSVSANIDAISKIKQTVLDEERKMILESIEKERLTDKNK
jgi:pyruvate,water dikinase